MKFKKIGCIVVTGVLALSAFIAPLAMSSKLNTVSASSGFDDYYGTYYNMFRDSVVKVAQNSETFPYPWVYSPKPNTYDFIESFPSVYNEILKQEETRLAYIDTDLVYKPFAGFYGRSFSPSPTNEQSNNIYIPINVGLSPVYSMTNTGEYSYSYDVPVSYNLLKSSWRNAELVPYSNIFKTLNGRSCSQLYFQEFTKPYIEDNEDPPINQRYRKDISIKLENFYLPWDLDRRGALYGHDVEDDSLYYAIGNWLIDNFYIDNIPTNSYFSIVADFKFISGIDGGFYTYDNVIFQSYDSSTKSRVIPVNHNGTGPLFNYDIFTSVVNTNKPYNGSYYLTYGDEYKYDGDTEAECSKYGLYSPFCNNGRVLYNSDVYLFIPSLEIYLTAWNVQFDTSYVIRCATETINTFKGSASYELTRDIMSYGSTVSELSPMEIVTDSFSSILNFELFPGFHLYYLFLIAVGVSIFSLALKLFLGG